MLIMINIAFNFLVNYYRWKKNIFENLKDVIQNVDIQNVDIQNVDIQNVDIQKEEIEYQEFQGKN